MLGFGFPIVIINRLVFFFVFLRLFVFLIVFLTLALALCALPRLPLTFLPRLIRHPRGGPLTLYISLPCAAARAARLDRYVFRAIVSSLFKPPPIIRLPANPQIHKTAHV